MREITFLFCLAGFVFQSCKTANKLPANASVEERAEYLSKKFIITDGHVDLPYKLKKRE